MYIHINDERTNATINGSSLLVEKAWQREYLWYTDSNKKFVPFCGPYNSIGGYIWASIND